LLGEKAKDAKETRHREEIDQRHAGLAYSTPEPEDLSTNDYDLSGLPWGGPSMRHIVERGKAKERDYPSRTSPASGVGYDAGGSVGYYGGAGSGGYGEYDYAASYGSGSGRGSESR
jgi:hypothetical protein